MIIVFALALVTCTCIFSAEAANIRGKLERATPNGQIYSANGIAVTLLSASNVRSNRVYSDKSGLYYLYNIPPGNYTLEIWATSSPQVQPVTVQPNVPQVDIPPIRLPPGQ